MNQLKKKWYRREFNRTNGMLLFYKFLFSQLTVLTMYLIYTCFPVGEDFLDGASWYLISGFVCLGVFVLWKRPSFFRTAVFPVRSHMTFLQFIGFFGVFMLAQNLSSFLYVYMELAANRFGYTLTESLASATGGAVTISMFLYSAFAAPLIEELIFRGAILKTLQPYGTWFALLASSLSFALMHGNFAQIPFAFAAGIILGYITVRYSIWHSVLLHIANNLLLGEVIPWFTGLLPDSLGSTVSSGISILLLLSGITMLLSNLKGIRAFCHSSSRNTGRLLWLYFSSLCGILFTVYCIWSGITRIVRL